MKNIIKGAVCLLVISAFGLTHAADEVDKPGNLSQKDYDFIKGAASSGITEVQAGHLAKNKGVNLSVKQFGIQMINEHGKANGELRVLAQRKGIELPKTPTEKEQKSLDKLSALNRDEFDRAYMKDMVADHEKVIKEFQWAAEKAGDPELRTWASNTLPTLQAHYQTATNTSASITAK